MLIQDEPTVLEASFEELESETPSLPEEPAALRRRVLGMAWPVIGENLLETLLGIVDTALVAGLGTAAVAGVGAGLQIMFFLLAALSLSFLPGIGFSMAATALVGQSIGAQKLRLGAGVAHIATVWAVIWMSTMGALIFVFAEPIMHLFTKLPEVARIGAAGLRMVALTQPFWAVGMVQSGGLRGTGDTRYPLLISTVGMWTTVLLVWLGLTFVGGAWSWSGARS